MAQLIHTIHSPKDIKRMSLDDLRTLAHEIRGTLLAKLSACGGHVASNLGLVETTIALHYVFDSPIDKFVFDTSHQTYTHKILTGRAKAYWDENHYGDVSGYSAPDESEHDHFLIGHTSTSVSLALGLCKGRDVCGGSENVIVVIGDGSLSGGQAMEGLNCAGEYEGNLIIIVNDNEQSIQENHGGIYKNLALLRETKGTAQNNWFTTQGLEYLYEENGHDIGALINVFEKVKDSQKPIVVHIHTKKGKGYKYAEESPEDWHYKLEPFVRETGENFQRKRRNYADVTAEFLLQKAAEIPELVVLTAGTCSVMGLTPERRKILGEQYIDSGIAEEHTAALASGIARRGGIPIWGTLGTFFQRSYDQLMHDVALNKSPVILLFFGCGASTATDITHTCLYDIAMLSGIPGIDYLAPTCVEEYESMLDWFVHNIHIQNRPVAIRVPTLAVVHRQGEWNIGYTKPNCFKIEQEGSGIAILAVGSFFSRAETLAELLKERGIKPTLINPRYVSGLDESMLEALKVNHKLVLTLEDGIMDGGFGEKVARFYSDSAMRVLVRGYKRQFYDYKDKEEFFTENRLQVEQLVEDILNVWKNN